MIFSVGQPILCNKNLYFCDGELCFSIGVIYKVYYISTEGGGYQLKNNQGELHYIGFEGEEDTWTHHFSVIRLFELPLKFI